MCPREKLLNVYSLVLALQVLLVLVIYWHLWPFWGCPAGQLCLVCLLSSLLGKVWRCIHSSDLLCICNEPEASLTTHIIVLQMVILYEEQHSFVLAASYSLNVPCKADLHVPRDLCLFMTAADAWMNCRAGQMDWSDGLGSWHIFPVKFEQVGNPHL